MRIVRYEGNEIIRTTDMNDAMGFLATNYDLLGRKQGETQIINGLDVTQTATPSMSVEIDPGSLWYKDALQLIINEDLQTVNIATADPTLLRKDIIQVRRQTIDYDVENRQFKDSGTGVVTTSPIATKTQYGMEIDVKTGIPGSDAPSVDSGWVKIAEVWVSGSATEITDSDIKNCDTEFFGGTNTDWTTDTTHVYQQGTATEISTRLNDQINDSVRKSITSQQTISGPIRVTRIGAGKDPSIPLDILGNGNISGSLTVQTSLSVTAGGITSFGGLIIDNGSSDGADLIFRSSGFNDWFMDNYLGNLRFVQGATQKGFFTPSGDELRLEGINKLSLNGQPNAGTQEGLMIQSAGNYTNPNAGNNSGISIRGGSLSSSISLFLGADSTRNASYIQAVRPGTAQDQLLLNPNGGPVGVRGLANYSTDQGLIVTAEGLYTEPGGGNVRGLAIKAGSALTTKSIFMGVDTTNNIAFLQAVTPGSSFDKLFLNPNGGGAALNGDLELRVSGSKLYNSADGFVSIQGIVPVGSNIGSTWVLGPGAVYVIPAGIYMVAHQLDVKYQTYATSYSATEWKDAIPAGNGGCIISDGTNVRVVNTSGSFTRQVAHRKF